MAKGKGRPKKTAAAPDASPAASPDASPEVVTSPEASPVENAIAQPENGDVEQAASETPTSPKRGRGRPRKGQNPRKALADEVAAEEESLPAKRPRGRPSSGGTGHIKLQVPKQGLGDFYRIILDINTAVLADKSVQNVSIRPPSKGQGDVVPPSGRVIHLTIDAPQA